MKTIKRIRDMPGECFADVNMQLIITKDDFDLAIKSLHRCLVEAHDYGRAICLAS